MHTIQKSFTYNGDLKKASVKSVGVNVKTPVYEYTENDAPGNEPITREVIGTDTTAIDKELNTKDYVVKLPESSIIGKDDLIFQKFLMYSIDSRKLDNLTTTIEVEYTVDTVNTIGSKTFEAIYFFKLIPRANLTFKRVNTFEFDKEHLILINKDSYLSLLSRLSKFSPPQDEFYLLEIILNLIDFNGEFPFLLKKIPDEVKNTVLPLLKSDTPELLELIIKSFPDLFDFPLSIPEIKTVDAAGKFTVLTNDNSKITKAELSYYDLLLEYTITDGKNTYQVIHVDMNKAGSTIQNNSINFSFTENRKILLNNIQDLISVKVKGFDGSVLWSKQFLPDAPELKELKIEVPLMKPVRLTPSDKNAPPDINKKIRGQVIVYNKDCPLKDISVIIRAKKDGGETFRIVGSAKTDNSGNFFMPYPFGRYTEAQAIVSLTPNDPVSIPVSDNNEDDQTISDDFLFLLVTNADCAPEKEEDDCDCNSPKKASRLPDHDDLIRSDEYSQDLGGSCINLSTPNRTLSEYNYQAVVRTSDPDVANYTLTKTTRSSFSKDYIASVNKFLSGNGTESPIDSTFKLTQGVGKIERKPVDLSNAVKWQDDPGDNNNLQIYQAVTVATGHILHYKSKFKADGYSLGDLLYSLALAPGQKKEIVVFDATHSLLGSETQQITQRESLAAAIVNDRSVTDQLGGNLNEAMQGQSSSTTGGISAGGGLGFSYGGFGASLGVSGGTSTTDASASQNSARDVSQFFDEKLKQTIMQNSESFRQLNASVVTTVKENQKYAATTEVVANHNHCHALTILYFEVLRHFAVYQELSSVEECVFVPFLMTNFTTENIYKWRDVLAPRLLPMPSNTYLSVAGFGGGTQHPLLKAFDANERIKSNYANVDFPAGSYDDERITNIKGSLTCRVNLGKPKTKYDRIKTFPVTTVTNILDFQTWLWSTFFFGLPAVNLVDQYVTIDANFMSVPPRDCIRVIQFDDNFFNKGKDIIDENLWRVYAGLLGYGSNVFAMLDNYFNGRLISEWEEIYNNDIAPIIFEKIVESFTFQPMSNGGFAAKFTPAIRYNGGEKEIGVYINGSTNLKRHEFDLNIVLAPNKVEIVSLNNMALFNIEEIQINYSTPHYNGTIYSGYSGGEIFGGISLFIPENSDEKRNPRKEDIFLVNKLIEHLNSNLEYYNKILWYRLDPDRRYMLLDGFNIELYNDLGSKVPPRSLASVVKNQLVTVAGNSLVFPVAAGYKVSNSFITELSPNGAHENVSLTDHYKPLTPIEPYRISVPSRGVFAETLQSYCNACEKIESDSRLQDWNKFPNTDEPTPFAPVNAPTPTVTDWKAVFKDFAPPMVNIQNAPALPAPGAGLAGLSDLLGKSGIFKDITGLDATQQAALKTYLSNQDNAKAFAEMAKELAMQDHNTQHADKISDSLKQAKDSGAINQDDYNKLTKQHLQQQIDGSSTPDKNAAKNETSLSKAAVDAASSGKDVKATKTDTSSGLAETLEVSGPPMASASPATDILMVKLVLPKPANVSELKYFDPTSDNIGFGAFDNAFDPARLNSDTAPYDEATNGLKPDFIDNDSHRFFIEILDSKADPSATAIEVDWFTTFGDRKTPYDLTANTKLTLTRLGSPANTFRSKALLLVHEEIDLTVVVDGKKTGDNDYRMRLAGMFSHVRILYNTRSDSDFTFPVFTSDRLRKIPVNIFTLRNSANIPVATADAVATSIAKLQDVYDSVGYLFDATSEYSFSGNTLAQKVPTPVVSKRNINYKVNEITVPNTINISDITEASLKAIADLVPAKPIQLRIFIIDKFNPAFIIKSPATIAMAMNRSFATHISANLVNCLFIEAIATGAGFPYTIAHEIGHILMDKFDFLATHKPSPLPIPAIENNQHHYNSANNRVPNNQNLMNPATSAQVSVFASKRIWNVADADQYNQFADLIADRMKLKG